MTDTPEHTRHDLWKIFEHCARENHELKRLAELARKVPQSVSALEIFNAVQSASFRKSTAILAGLFAPRSNWPRRRPDADLCR
jgi:benzoyl-CoA reductase/2-hydroxyglutaryl-CoA dehydratase subunit BcrC/BadD/HgdB